MLTRPTNVQSAWLAGTLTTVLFVGTFVPITLQRGEERVMYRSELANEIVARNIADTFARLSSTNGASEFVRTEAMSPSDDRPFEVLTLPPALTEDDLARIGVWLDPTTGADAQMQMLSLQSGPEVRAMLAMNSNGMRRAIELDLSSISADLESVLGDNWLEFGLSVDGEDSVSFGLQNHTDSVFWTDTVIEKRIATAQGGSISTSYREHRPALPIETILVMILATVGMFATWIGARLMAQLDSMRLKIATRLEKTEDELSIAQEISDKAQKLDAVGKLSGGVAHDFNNLLAIILGNAEYARDRSSDADVVSALNEIAKASLRGSDLTKSMLAFARQSRLEATTLDLNKVVRDAQSWMARALPSSIAIEVSLLAGLWSVSIDKTTFESALLNLLLNAKDAMNDKGKLTIETANVRIDEDYITDRAEDLEPGRYVMLAVSDNGAGIADNDIDFIFDPFFTTKQASRGTGLGLSMVQGFIKQSGGTIRVYSELGKGTTFKLYIPALLEEAASDEVPSIRQFTEDVNGRLLLVEDNEEVMKVISRQLLESGYELVEARSGDEALEIYRHDQGFDLVVTDIVMPGELQGPALAKQIRKLNPDQRFIFISGYANEAQVHGNGLQPEDIRLTKPIQRDDLIANVRKALSDR